ncbi:MAG: SDR family NAD(P)-dependent oxidoreductase [Sphingomonas sp.]|nr:SDR family NAD(P)-dependent oxidoreductase [Sphingomonas sp.]
MSVELKPLAEQTIVLTGATSGNGLATAREAAARGARLVLAARNGDALEKIADELRAGGAQVVTCVADVAVETDMERLADAAIEAFGGFDTWINNAAAATYGKVEKIPMEDHRRVFDVNYFGLLKGSLIAARHLRKRGGAIINIGSILSDRPAILQGPYSASKHAVKAATDTLRMELDEEGAPISVTLIKPGAMHTPYPEHARNYMDEPARLPPILYNPRLVADAILFAAENPRRHLYVGGFGYLISLGGRLAPRIVDKAMVLFGRRLQTDSKRPPDPALQDNLYEPRKDGAVDGHQDYYVRGTSVWLQAQKHPVVATAATAAVAGVGLFAWSRLRGATAPANAVR